MCKHSWVEINDVRVCTRCGLTVRKTDGKIMFDRRFANIGKTKKGRRRK